MGDDFGAGIAGNINSGVAGMFCCTNDCFGLP